MARANAISDRMTDVHDTMGHVLRFIAAHRERADAPDVSDFAFGNPHEPPLPDFVSALQTWSQPQNKDWFAYKMSERKATETVAASLRERYGVPFEPDDVCMTNGAFAALTVALAAVVDPGDEVVFVTPPWFFYEAIIVSLGAVPIRVPCDRETFDLDLDALADALSPRTRAVIVNSPNNPTGRIYPPETLRRLATLLEEASARNERRVYLMSDEAYSQVVYDGRDFPSPTTFYPASLMLYTYGKTLLTPGQRLGYIALPPDMPAREALREALVAAQLVTGYAFPNALLQHALPDLEALSIDVDHLERKRDRLVGALTAQGYRTHVPEGTFYLMVDAPWPDDEAFCALLAEHGVLCLPGSVVELPGTFRLSLTANDEMIERAISRFAAAREQAAARAEA